MQSHLVHMRERPFQPRLAPLERRVLPSKTPRIQRGAATLVIDAFRVKRRKIETPQALVDGARGRIGHP